MLDLMPLMRNSDAHQVNQLIAFMHARLDEDERIAQNATEGPWIDEFSGETGRCVIPADAENTREYVARTQLLAAMPDAQHIARWDPARVLAEVAAKRRIIEDCRVTVSAVRRIASADLDAPGLDAMRAGRDALVSVLRLLASVHADHPDYPVKGASDMTTSEIQPGHARVLLTVGDIAHVVTALHPPTAPLKVPAARIAGQAGLPESELPGRRFTITTLTDVDADGFALLDDPRV